VLLLRFSVYLNSVLIYRFLILDAFHPDTMYLREKDVRIRGYFSKPKEICELKNLGIENNAPDFPTEIYVILKCVLVY
jgi:hypothetical protein